MENLTAVARILLALVFVVSGVRQCLFRDKVMAGIAKQGIPLAGAMLAAAIVVEIVAGLALSIGYRAQWASVALIAFTMVSTAFFYRDLRNPDSQLHLMKNCAIVGGLILVAIREAATRTS